MPSCSVAWLVSDATRHPERASASRRAMCEEVSQILLRVMPIAGRVALCAVLCCSAIAAACSGRVLKPQYEYEEELYLNLDGSATLNLNASVASLVALRDTACARPVRSASRDSG